MKKPYDAERRARAEAVAAFAQAPGDPDLGLDIREVVDSQGWLWIRGGDGRFDEHTKQPAALVAVNRETGERRRIYADHVLDIAPSAQGVLVARRASETRISVSILTPNGAKLLPDVSADNVFGWWGGGIDIAPCSDDGTMQPGSHAFLFEQADGPLLVMPDRVLQWSEAEARWRSLVASKGFSFVTKSPKVPVFGGGRALVAAAVARNGKNVYLTFQNLSRAGDRSGGDPRACRKILMRVDMTSGRTSHIRGYFRRRVWGFRPDYNLVEQVISDPSRVDCVLLATLGSYSRVSRWVDDLAPTDGVVLRLCGNQSEAVLRTHFSHDEGEFPDGFYALAATKDGRVWAASRNAMLYFFEPGGSQGLPTTLTNGPGFRIGKVLQDLYFVGSAVHHWNFGFGPYLEQAAAPSNGCWVVLAQQAARGQ